MNSASILATGAWEKRIKPQRHSFRRPAEPTSPRFSEDVISFFMWNILQIEVLNNHHFSGILQKCKQCSKQRKNIHECAFYNLSITGLGNYRARGSSRFTLTMCFIHFCPESLLRYKSSGNGVGSWKSTAPWKYSKRRLSSLQIHGPTSPKDYFMEPRFELMLGPWGSGISSWQVTFV